MDCVKLYFKDNLIGVLTQDNKNSRYIFEYFQRFVQCFLLDIAKKHMTMSMKNQLELLTQILIKVNFGQGCSYGC